MIVKNLIGKRFYRTWEASNKNKLIYTVENYSDNILTLSFYSYYNKKIEISYTYYTIEEIIENFNEGFWSIYELDKIIKNI